MDEHVTATGPKSDESPPSNRISGQENTPSTSVSTSASSGAANSSCASHGESSSSSPKHVPSIQRGSSHIHNTSPIRRFPTDECLRSGKKETNPCKSGPPPLQPELVPQNLEGNVVPEQGPINLPSSDLIDDNESYSGKCLPLHIAALKGDVTTARGLLGDSSWLGKAITKTYETIFHVAAGAKQKEFLEEMLQLLEDKAFLELPDKRGNTAFCNAVAAGNIQIAEILLNKNEKLLKIRGIQSNTPLYIAALFGQGDMALFLYGKIEKLKTEGHGDLLEEKEDRRKIFFMSIHAGLYDLASKLLRIDKNLAVARDEDGESTALHLLAKIPSAFPSESWGPLKMLKNLLISVVPEGMTSSAHKGKASNQALDLLNELWERILSLQDFKVRLGNFEFLFDAARLGNFEFLRQLISRYPCLALEFDDDGQSIFHIAILYRHMAILNLMDDIGIDKQWIAGWTDKKGNNLLHLAGKYLPRGRAASTVPGAALEMQLELKIFKEVESLVLPTYKELKNWDNSEGSEPCTPWELFTKDHAELLKSGEEWMKQAASSCSFVAALIATVVFDAASNAPDGESHYTAFRIFAMANAVALSSSSISLLMFLYILTSRYTENDFLLSLPLKLVIGISMLLVSIVAMMLSFSSSFFLTFKQPIGRFPVSITGIVFLSVLVFLWLQYGLIRDILYSSFCFGRTTKSGAPLFGCWSINSQIDNMELKSKTEKENESKKKEVTCNETVANCSKAKLKQTVIS